jgi:ankyrin repeat protein
MGWTGLQYACARDSVDVVKRLLDAKANIETRDNVSR